MAERDQKAPGRTARPVGRRAAIVGLGAFGLVGAGALAFRGQDLLKQAAGVPEPQSAIARARAASNGEALALTWNDLRPETEASLLEDIAAAGRLAEAPLPIGSSDNGLLGVVPHGSVTAEMSLGGDDQVADLDGATVSLPGYTVPLTYGPEGSDNFLLVPYIGACVHVPPPPPNQIVHVTSEAPIRFAGLFDAVTVTGVIRLIDEDLQLAQVGYRIEAREVVRYESGWTSSSDPTPF